MWIRIKKLHGNFYETISYDSIVKCKLKKGKTATEKTFFINSLKETQPTYRKWLKNTYKATYK